MLEQVNFVYPMEPGIYKVAALPEKKNNQPNGPTSFTDSLGYGFVYVGSEYKEPNKLYGNVIERSTYIWNNFVRNEASSGVLLTGQKGGGKMSRNSSLVRIPDGWEQIGNLKVGDTVVAVDGSYTRVKGVYPQGIKQLYRITFADGRIHDCGAEHLWSVYKVFTKTHKEDGKRVADEYGYKLHTMSTTEMMSHLKANISLYIPLMEPEKNAEKDFFIHPYILGCLIGDGSITNGVRFTISDKKVIDRLVSFLHKDYKISEKIFLNKSVPTRTIIRKIHYGIDKDGKTIRFSNEYSTELQRLGLLGLKSIDKFIPSEYLNGSVEQRYELLRGLMDTDGWVKVAEGRNKTYFKNNGDKICGSVYFGSSSRLLIDCVKQLIWSLGGEVRESKKIPFYTYKNKRLRGNTFYILLIRLPNPRLAFTRVHKRLERLNGIQQYTKNHMLRITSIAMIDQDYATCIEVEHPSHLYVAEDYIVTHNTVLAKHLANIAISKGLKVFVIAEIRVDRKLISFISGLNNCVIFIDEFYKVIGWQFQDDFLSLMSDKNKKRLFILTENELSNINRFILDRPERIRYHYEYSTLDPNVIKEFCRDYNVPEDFKNKLLKLNMSNRNFSFDHLHALVTEAINSGKWDIEWLIEIMNVKSLKMKEIKRPIKVCAVDTPEIFIELEPSPIDQDLGVVKLGNSMLQANYLTWKKLRDNETMPEPLLANYNLTKEKIDKFEDKMLLLEKIEKQAGNLNVDGLLPGNRRRNYDFDNGQQQVTDTPTNIIKVNFSPEFMVGMDNEYSIYLDVTGEFKVYIETKKLIY